MVKMTFTPTVAGKIERLPRTIQARMFAVCDRLEKWPDVSGVKPLSGELAGRFRLGTGNYRVQFQVQGDTVVVAGVWRRSGFNED